MQRIDLTKKLSLSRIVYGMWRLGDDVDRSPKQVQAKIEACLAQGITSFDQADIYGDYESETILGECLKAQPDLREKMEIVTKCDILLLSGKAAERRVKHYDTSAEHINASVEASLSNMAAEHIDLLLLHRPDPLMDHHETGAALDGLVKSGKVGAIGVSNFKAHDWNLLQSAMKNKLVTNQIEVSLLEVSPFINGDLAFLQQEGIAPMAWSPLGGGGLFGGTDRAYMLRKKITERFGKDADISAIAVAWLLHHPANIMPVMGTNNLDRIAALSHALGIEMDRQTWFELYEASLGHEVP